MRAVRQSSALPYLLLLLPVVFWGTSFRAGAIGVEHTSGLMLGALRTVPVLAFVPLMPLVGARLPRGRVLFWSAVTGILTVTILFSTTTVGIDLAGAANAAVLTNTSPFFVLVLARIFLAERITPIGLGGLLVGFVGVVVMVSSQLGGAGDTGDLVLGIVLSVVAAAAWGVGTLIVRWLVVRDPALDFVGLTAAQFLFGAPVLLAIAFAVDGTGGTDWGSSELWGSAVYLGIGGTVIGTVAYFIALRYLSATKASSAQFLVPAVAVVVEIARGATPDALQLVGIVLAIAGVVAVVLGGSLRGRARGVAVDPMPPEHA